MHIGWELGIEDWREGKAEKRHIAKFDKKIYVFMCGTFGLRREWKAQKHKMNIFLFVFLLLPTALNWCWWSFRCSAVLPNNNNNYIQFKHEYLSTISGFWFRSLSGYGVLSSARSTCKLNHRTLCSLPIHCGCIPGYCWLEVVFHIVSDLLY